MTAALAVGSVLLANGSYAAGETTYYFTSDSVEAGCDSVPLLATTPTDGFECARSLVINGQGLPGDEKFAAKKKEIKVDGSRSITGELHLICEFALSGPVPSFPGYVSADFAFKIGSTDVGSVHAEGAVPPAGSLVQAVDLKIPTALDKQKVDKVEVNVTWVTTGGICAVGQAEGRRSMFKVPTL